MSFEDCKTRSDYFPSSVECGYTTASPWPALPLPGSAPVDLDPVAAAWGRKLYPPPGAGPTRAGGLMFGLHHHQDPSAGGLHHHHHHHQPRGPVTSLKEEPLATTQLSARSWMQPAVVDQSRSVVNFILTFRTLFWSGHKSFIGLNPNYLT